MTEKPPECILVLVRLPERRPAVLGKVILHGDGGAPIEGFIVDYERIHSSSGTVIGAVADIPGIGPEHVTKQKADAVKR